MNPPLLRNRRLQQAAGSGIAFLLLLAALLFAGCHNTPRPVDALRPPPLLPPTDMGIVHPGDTLGVMFSISDKDKETFELVKTVRETGTITLLSNEVFTVTNKFPEQIEAEIHNRYASVYSEQLSARVLFTCCRWYRIEGAVRSPGRQVCDDSVSLFDAINAAGGMTRKANPTRVSITMDGAVATIDLTRPESEEGRKFQVQPGMRILVPSSPWWWLK